MIAIVLSFFVVPSRAMGHEYNTTQIYLDFRPTTPTPLGRSFLVREGLDDVPADPLVTIRSEQLGDKERVKVVDFELLGLRESLAIARLGGARGRTYAFLKFGNLDRDGAGGVAVSEGVVADLVLDELTEQERQHLLVIRRDTKVLPTSPDQLAVQAEQEAEGDIPESTLELFLDTTLLRAHKAPHHHLDREIDIVAPHILPKMHLGARFAHSNHTLEMTNSDRVRSGRKGFPTEVGVETRDLVLVHLVELGTDPIACILDVLAKQVLRDDLLRVSWIARRERREDVRQGRGKWQCSPRPSQGQSWGAISNDSPRRTWQASRR